jgi:hypothetical protein
MEDPPRWRAVVYYRTDHGLVDVTHDFEELMQLHDLVEAGPDWNTIDRIEIRLRLTDYPLTVEEAREI